MRGEDGVWCRHSTHPFCSIDPKALAQIAATIGVGRIPVLGAAPSHATTGSAPEPMRMIDQPGYHLNYVDTHTANRGMIWSIEKGPDPLGLDRVTVPGEPGNLRDAGMADPHRHRNCPPRTAKVLRVEVFPGGTAKPADRLAGRWRR